MKSNLRRALWVFFLIVFAVVVYGVAFFVRSLDRSNWGLPTASSSAGESQASGFYLGVYTPANRFVKLNYQTIEISDA